MISRLSDLVGQVVRWQKSTKSGGNDGGSDCVEVAVLENGYRAVRDSKQADMSATRRPVLQFTEGEWFAFVGGVLGGEFTESNWLVHPQVGTEHGVSTQLEFRCLPDGSLAVRNTNSPNSPIVLISSTTYTRLVLADEWEDPA